MEQDKKYQFELDLDKQRNQQKNFGERSKSFKIKNAVIPIISLAMTNHYVLNYLNLRKIEMIWMHF